MARGIIGKTNKTITTETYMVGDYNNGDKGLPFTAILENGERLNITVRFSKESIIAIPSGCTIIWTLDGYKKALTTYKREWNRLSKKYGDEPRIEKLEIRPN